MTDTRRTDDQVLPDKSSDYQAAEATRVESSRALLDELNSDPYSRHQGANILGKVNEFVHDRNDSLPEVDLVDEQAGKISARFLNGGRSQVVEPDGTVTTQMPDGRVIEYSPNLPPDQRYRLVEGDKRTTLDPNTVKDVPVSADSKPGPPPSATQTFADGRIVTSFPEAKPGERSQMVQFPAVLDEQGKPRTDRPLQQDTFLPNPALTGPESSPERRAGRTVSRFSDRTETSFTPAKPDGQNPEQLRITKVTAFKGDDPQGRAVITEYGPGGRPEDGAARVTRFKDGNPQGIREQAEIPAKPPANSAEVRTKFADNSVESQFNPPKDGVRSRLEMPGPPKTTQEVKANGDVTTKLEPPIRIPLAFPRDGSPNAQVVGTEVRQITRKADGTYLLNDKTTPERIVDPSRSDGKIKLATSERTGGVFADGSREKAATTPGDTARPRPDAPPRPGEVTFNNNTGLPETARIGETTYRPTFGDNGRLNGLTLNGPGGEIKLTPEAGGMRPSQPLKDASGKVVQNGEAILDGFKVKVKDGLVQGEFHVNKKGEVIYREGNGADRVEQMKKSDGSMVRLDFKTYERTEVGPPPKNEPRPTKYWDGFNFRDGEKKTDPSGKTIVEFKPKPGEPGFDPSRPAVLERNGTPPADTAAIKFKDAQGQETRSISADWNKHVQTEVRAGNPPQTIVRMDAGGGNYREIEGTPQVNGDSVTVKFKPGRDNEPVSATYKKDGSIVTEYKDSRVIRNPEGRITELQQPKDKPKYQFAYDADGDLKEQVIIRPDGTKEKLVRTGVEQAPMMGAAVGRNVQGEVAPPGSPQPPRKIGDPRGFNTWRREPAPNPATAENPATVQMNVFVTADGAIIREKPGARNGDPIEVSTEHVGKGFTETVRGNTREFKGPDGQTLTSSDGQKWKFPGDTQNREFQGKPVVTADGSTVIRSTRPETVPGSRPPQTREVSRDIRRNEDPTSSSISELDTASGKEIQRTFDNGTVVTFDAQGNPASRVTKGTPPIVQNFKFENGKCTEISDASKTPSVVTHKIENGALRPVGKPNEQPIEVTRDGRVLQRTDNPAGGSVEQLGNVGLVRDASGTPVRIDGKKGDKPESWKIESHKEGNRVVIDRVIGSDGKPVADATGNKGAIRIDAQGRVAQESRPGSGVFDRVTSIDGRTETAQSRNRTNENFALSVDNTKTPPVGTLRDKAGQNWQVEYSGAAPTGDVYPVKKITIPPAKAGGQPETLEVGKNGVQGIAIDENTGRISVNRGDTATVYDPGKPEAHRTDISREGVRVTFNRDNLRTQMTDRNGTFKVNETFEATPAPGRNVIQSIEGPNGTPKFDKANGELSLDPDGTIRQVKDNKEVAHHRDGRVVTTTFTDNSRATKSTIVTETGNRRITTDGAGKLKEVATKVGDTYQPWTFEPAAAAQNLTLTPGSSEIKLPNEITKVKLPDGSEVSRQQSTDELFLRQDGSIARRHSIAEGGRQYRETVHHGDNKKSEVFRTALPSNDAIQWSYTTQGNQIVSVRLPDTNTDTEMKAGTTAQLVNNEVVITPPPPNPQTIIAPNGKVFSVQNGTRTELPRRTPR